MTVSAPVASTYQRLGSPSDSESADLDELLDAGWAWRAYCREFGGHEFEPHEVTVVQFNHTPGRRATVLYEAEWPPDVYIPSEQFTLRKEPGEPAQIFRFPEDPDLPGLASAVFPETAHELIKGHVLALPPRRMRVDVVRYRPGNHAALRHRMGKARFLRSRYAAGRDSEFTQGRRTGSRLKLCHTKNRGALARRRGNMDIRNTG